MKILVIDTETTGLNSEKDHLIEIATILFSVTHKSILMQVSTIISYKNDTIINLAEPINKIPSQLLKEDFPYESVVEVINNMSNQSTYICAHNADFDQKFCQKILGLKISDSVWIDTQDLSYPNTKYYRGSSLNGLAIAHSIPVVDAHRALDDCRTLVKLLSTISDLEQELIKASRPKVLVKSLEDKPGTLSKAHRFKWNSIIPYSWAKYMPEEDIKDLPFNAVKVSLNEDLK
jgi:DNA polymerase III subunit epsilon